MCRQMTSITVLHILYDQLYNFFKRYNMEFEIQFSNGCLVAFFLYYTVLQDHGFIHARGTSLQTVLSKYPLLSILSYTNNNHKPCICFGWCFLLVDCLIPVKRSCYQDCSSLNRDTEQPLLVPQLGTTSTYPLVINCSRS